MAETPRAVVFDVGHVLVDWHPRYLYEKLIADRFALEAFLDDVLTLDWHFQHDLGRPFAETSAELVARHPQHRALIEAFGPRFSETIPGPIEGMPELVAELDAADVPLYAITNFSGEWFPETRRTYAAMFDRFRDIVVSGDERMAKPDAAIFHLALDRFGLGRDEALFVDDKANNVWAAEQAGFVGHRFVDAPTLRVVLEEYGLL